ncbi:MAG: 4Fe-4S dicluster domain-containing protein [Chloroflexota bacterium]
MSIGQVASFLLLVSGLAILLGMGGFGIASLVEGERRAARRAFALALAGAALFSLAAIAPVVLRLVFLVVCTLSLAAFGVLFVLPIGRVAMGDDTPKRRVDEREIMFARARLRPDSAEYQSYYAMHPEHQESDDRTRSKPGLLSLQARFANPFLFASPEGSFGLTGALREAVDGPVAGERQVLPAEELTAYLKSLARYYGALEVGVTELQPYHVYTHVGRGTGTYGDEVRLPHRYALAFTVAMDLDMVAAAPMPPIVMESARQYVESARVAVQLAGAIRALGYPARAHIDGNYRVIAPLVGRDAGLGEIGRMGLLMSPRQGPRLRLGVVTVDADLISDGRKTDGSVVDFCSICKKCATNCPSQSIPFGERSEIDGALRWQINSEACFHYWNVIGTDCGRCMAVCPYAHADNAFHNLVRWGIVRSGFFRRLAYWMDDFFYGEKPERHPGPAWTRVPG